MEISCEQVESLMNFYLDGDLSDTLTASFERHLSHCKPCREKYEAFKGIITDLRESYNRFGEMSTYKSSGIKSYEENLNSTISAYVDNELQSSENIKIKKLIITKPEVRGKIEKIYNLKKLLKGSFESSNLKQDYSKIILREITNPKSFPVSGKLVFTVLSLICLCVIWVVMLLSALYI